MRVSVVVSLLVHMPSVERNSSPPPFPPPPAPPPTCLLKVRVMGGGEGRSQHLLHVMPRCKSISTALAYVLESHQEKKLFLLLMPPKARFPSPRTPALSLFPAGCHQRSSHLFFSPDSTRATSHRRGHRNTKLSHQPYKRSQEYKIEPPAIQEVTGIQN